MPVTSKVPSRTRRHDGHLESLDALVTRFSPLLRCVIRKRLNRCLAGLIEAEDILQDVWAITCRPLQIALEDDTLADPRAWLCRVAKWRTWQANRDHLDRSKRQRQRQVSLADAADTTLDREASPALQASAHEEYDRAVQGGYGTRILVAVLSLEGYTRDDIAHRLGLSLSTLRRREIEEEERKGGYFFSLSG